jgi:2-oxoglutarate-dependent dioxygenase
MTPPTLNPVLSDWKLDGNEIAFYRKEGYLTLPGLMHRDAAEQARGEVLEILRSGCNLTDADLSGRSERKHALVQTPQYLAGSVLDRLINSAELSRIASQLLGGPACLYMPFTAVKSGGGGGRFSFHQDNQYTRFTDGLLGINIWFALSTMAPETGCLQICPRSHLRGTLDSDPAPDGHRKTKFEPESFLPIRMNPGDAVAFSRLTIHGSGINVTDAPRVGYAVQFHRDDALAVWDQQPPRTLKGANRWPTGPVEVITPPDSKGRDGH